MSTDQQEIQQGEQMEVRQQPANGNAALAQQPPQEVFGGKPKQAMEQMQEVVQMMSDKCANKDFISNIQGKQYPRVEWWTTVGASLGLFPVVEYAKKLDRDDETAYEAKVSVRRNGNIITSGEAICSSKEKNWSNRDEYAIKSMAQTRATGKAYRNGLAFIAVMAGLEGTPAEEMSGAKNGGGSPVSKTIDRFKELHGVTGDGKPPWDIITDYCKQVSGGDKWKITDLDKPELDKVNELLDQKEQAKQNGNDPDDIASKAAESEADDLPFAYALLALPATEILMQVIGGGLL